MEKIFDFIGRFKPQDEFVWTEYLNFLSFEERLLKHKVSMAQTGLASGDQFLTDPANQEQEQLRIYGNMYDSMMKKTYALMQLGWQNDK